MLRMYVNYICRRCNKEMILITEEVESTLREGKYLSCSHCGSKNIKEENISDCLKDCMKARSYKRNKRGAIESKDR